MIPWIASAWASKLGRPIMLGAGVLLLVGLVFLLGRCSKDDYEDDYEAQIEQTDRSSDAVATAAKNALDTLEGRVATEDAVDQATQEALNNIGRAATPGQVRDAVIASLCSKPSHANDPACVPNAESRE